MPTRDKMGDFTADIQLCHDCGGESASLKSQISTRTGRHLVLEQNFVEMANALCSDKLGSDSVSVHYLIAV